MWHALLSVASLILGVTLMQVGNGQFGTFLSVRMQAEMAVTILWVVCN